MSEHDFEPIRGLPGELPAGEHILWQGEPRWTLLAQQAFHVRAVAGYFGVMFAWRAGAAVMAGQPPMTALRSILMVAPIALIAVGMLALLAWLNSRTTVYTITNKRVVLRFGAAVPKAINIPFAIIDGAAVKALAHGSGDLALSLKAPNKLAFLHLWPHARPWRMASPQPTLRALADVQVAAGVLASAMKAEAPIEVTRVETPSRSRTHAGGLSSPGAVAA